MREQGGYRHAAGEYPKSGGLGAALHRELPIIVSNTAKPADRKQRQDQSEPATGGERGEAEAKRCARRFAGGEPAVKRINPSAEAATSRRRRRRDCK